MHGLEGVAVFWDYEICPVPSNASGYAIVDNIRSLVQPYGSVKSFKAYLEISEQAIAVQKSLALRSELQSSGVSLVDCPHNGRKDVADKMMIVDMLAHAIDNPAPSTVVLITGDRDFAYAMSILRLRRYRVILVTLPNAHASLTAQASIRFDWNNYILDQTQTSATGPNHAGSSPSRERSWDPVTLSSPHSPRGQNARGTDDLDRKDRLDITQAIRFATQNRLDSQLSPENSFGYPALGRNGQNTSASGDIGCSGIRNAASPAALPRTLPSVLPKPADLPYLSPSPSFSMSPLSAPSLVKPYPTPLTTAISTPTITASRVLESSPYPSMAPSASSPSSGPVIQPKPPTVVPDIFKILVQTLRTHRSKGDFRPLRSMVSIEISNNGTTYKKAGVKKFGQYVAMAEELGIIQLGGSDGEAWICLKPKWFS